MNIGALNQKSIIILVAVFSVVFAAWFFVYGMSEKEPRSFQGYIEGKLVLVGSEQPGRIEKLTLLEGAQVNKGDFLFLINQDLAIARLEETDAALTQAIAQLANLTTQQQRPERIKILTAARKRAVAALDYAEKEFKRAEILVRRSVSSRERLDRLRSEKLQKLAALEEIDNQIIVARLSARKDLIKAAKAGVLAAREAKHQARIILEKLNVKSPVKSSLQRIYFRAGEVVAAGQPVMALLPPRNLRALFYVPERFLSSLSVGKKVRILCDGCGEKLFANISFVAQNAEFTPPIIYGPKERSKLVFRVEATPVGKALDLSPGQPITVVPAEPTSNLS